MAGYNWTCGMSNNAVLAYNTGELPASKACKAFGIRSTQAVRSHFSPSSYHHTSKFFNSTDFFNIEDELNGLEWEDFCKLFRKIKPDLTKKGIQIFKSFGIKALRKKLIPLETKSYKHIQKKIDRIKYLTEKYGKLNKTPYHLSDANWKNCVLTEIKNKNILLSLEFYEAEAKEKDLPFCFVDEKLVSSIYGGIENKPKKHNSINFWRSFNSGKTKIEVDLV